MLIFLFILAALLVGMGIVILRGKGDNLIAGYNTASKEERAKYDIKKLRLLIGGLLIVLVPSLFIIADEPSLAGTLAFASLVICLSIVVVILCNTWAKKKSK